MARLSQMIASFMGGKTKVTEFMPSYKEKVEKKVSKLASTVMALFGGKT